MEVTVSQALMGQLLVDVEALNDKIKGLSAELAEPLQAIADAI
jgi:hypothetical protein